MSAIFNSPSQIWTVGRWPRLVPLRFQLRLIGWSTASAGLFMSGGSFLGVIPSDERSEESRDPFGRQQSQTCCCPRSHIVISRSYRGPSTPHPPDPQERRVGNSLRCSAQDD